MDHLKMAVAKIDAHHSNVLLVEKSVSRYAQEYLLAKDISLVLNIKRPLLERIARCTGAQIVPSIDHLTSPKLGYCDVLHVEKFLEEHGSAGQGGKKLTKTLMFFEGCPKPLGYTILLKGANGDELKKVKHVVQYGVFAAYHLALETSFLAYEGATLPELSLKSLITVALPDKPSSIDRSISIIPGFTIPSSKKPMVSQPINELHKSKKVISDKPSSANIEPPFKSIGANQKIKTTSSGEAIMDDRFSSLCQKLSEAPNFGRMVACFRYASINVHSVYLPSPKLEFNYNNHEWIQSEADEEVMSSSIPKLGLKPISSVEKLLKMNVYPKPSGDHREKGMEQDFNNRIEVEPSLSSKANTNEKSVSLESGTVNGYSISDSVVADLSTAVNSDSENRTSGHGEMKVACSPQFALPTMGLENVEKSMSWESMPFPNFYSSFNKNSSFNAQKLSISEYNPVHVSSFRELERQSGARLLLPIGVNDTVVPVCDDEPTSIIAYALVSSDYHSQMSELERPKDAADSAVSLSLFDSMNLISLNSFNDSSSDTYRSFGSGDESILSLSGLYSSLVSDPLLYTKDLHARVSFTDDGPLGKVKYSDTCYYAKRFESLRMTCCPSELDFIRSLSRCKKRGAQGGKNNVFLAKNLDDRFIIKQVTKTELESFIKFGPAYFKYLSDSISTRSPSCLAKILGIYQHISECDVLGICVGVRNVARLYDLKGSSRSRNNPDTSGSNKVLLDQNLIEAMPASPIFVGSKAKRLLERAVWNDTSFLALIDVMDYSLLVGVDEEKHELVLGIIDFMWQYTWDKQLETWVKTTGILGGPKNTSPTVISPQQYKKRFRKAMTAYFLMVPDQWSSTSYDNMIM
ncbi:hypothetical protein CRYUN_Cryun33cG0076800 [Craigia yunnanensis]